MKKKIIISLSVLLLVIATSAISLAVNNAIENNKKKVPSDYKIGIPYEQAIKSDKPMLALFYVDWCGYCLRFMPKYKEIHSAYKDKFSVVMLNAEEPKNQSLVADVKLTGFPTLYIIDPKYDNRLLLNNALYLDKPSLQKELDRYLRIRSLLDKGAECTQGK